MDAEELLRRWLEQDIEIEPLVVSPAEREAIKRMTENRHSPHGGDAK